MGSTVYHYKYVLVSTVVWNSTNLISHTGCYDCMMINMYLYQL